MRERICYKIATLVHKSMHYAAPSYLSELCTESSTVPGRRGLRSADEHRLLVSCTQSARLGARPFAVCGPVALMFGAVYQTPLCPLNNSEADLKLCYLCNIMVDYYGRLCGFGKERRGRRELYYYYLKVCRLFLSIRKELSFLYPCQIITTITYYDLTFRANTFYSPLRQ